MARSTMRASIPMRAPRRPISRTGCFIGLMRSVRASSSAPWCSSWRRTSSASQRDWNGVRSAEGLNAYRRRDVYRRHGNAHSTRHRAPGPSRAMRRGAKAVRWGAQKNKRRPKSPQARACACSAAPATGQAKPQQSQSRKSQATRLRYRVGCGDNVVPVLGQDQVVDQQGVAAI